MTTFLKRVLYADAAISGASGLLLFFGAATFHDLLGIPIGLARDAGIVLLPFSIFLMVLARRERVHRLSVWCVIAMNVAWIAGSVALLFVDQIELNRLGVAFILIQAGAVALFAEMQYVGLRRATA